MSPTEIKTPKAIICIYINKERLWLKVDKFKNNSYCGYIDSTPISKGITHNQCVKCQSTQKQSGGNKKMILVFVFVWTIIYRNENLFML